MKRCFFSRSPQLATPETDPIADESAEVEEHEINDKDETKELDFKTRLDSLYICTSRFLDNLTAGHQRTPTLNRTTLRLSRWRHSKRIQTKKTLSFMQGRTERGTLSHEAAASFTLQPHASSAKFSTRPVLTVDTQRQNDQITIKGQRKKFEVTTCIDTSSK